MVQPPPRKKGRSTVTLGCIHPKPSSIVGAINVVDRHSERAGLGETLKDQHKKNKIKKKELQKNVMSAYFLLVTFFYTVRKRWSLSFSFLF